MNKIFLLDNYDSFTYNLYHLIQRETSLKVVVSRKPPVFKWLYKAFIISPGPGNPKTTPRAMKLLKSVYKKKPVLGICLGMQCLNYLFKGETVKADYPVHGKSYKISHTKEELFKDIPDSISVARYHSLIIDVVKEFNITATYKNIPMGITHKTLPLYGLQFHPESFLTEYGDKMIRNFLESL